MLGPDLLAAAVCTMAEWPSDRIVSIMPRTVIGLTNEADASAELTPSGRTRQKPASARQYWLYIVPPAAATTRPTSSSAPGPAATTVPAPSLPAGRG